MINQPAMCSSPHLVLVSLAPHSLGLGLHAGHGIEHSDSTVQHTQGTLHLWRNVQEDSQWPSSSVSMLQHKCSWADWAGWSEQVNDHGLA